MATEIDKEVHYQIKQVLADEPYASFLRMKLTKLGPGTAEAKKNKLAVSYRSGGRKRTARNDGGDGFPKESIFRRPSGGIPDLESPHL
ncbi:hypothetical protein [Peribacillus muralis]|uniref:hypothetical protein n=1 Tax=Peribacillus muralis TaxID=264697 RepID=UPI003D01F984